MPFKPFVKIPSQEGIFIDFHSLFSILTSWLKEIPSLPRRLSLHSDRFFVVNVAITISLSEIRGGFLYSESSFTFFFYFYAYSICTCSSLYLPSTPSFFSRYINSMSSDGKSRYFLATTCKFSIRIYRDFCQWKSTSTHPWEELIFCLFLHFFYTESNKHYHANRNHNWNKRQVPK